MDEDGRKRVLLAHLANLTNIVASESDEKSTKGKKDLEICVARIGALVGESPKMASEDWWRHAVKRLMDAVAARLRRQDRMSPESDRTGKIWLKFVEALPKRDVPPRDPPEWFVSELRDIYAEFCRGDDIDAELPWEVLVRIRDLMAKAAEVAKEEEAALKE